MAVVQYLSRARPPLKRSSSAAALFCSSVEDAEGVAAIERICRWVAALKLPARGIAAANVPWNANPSGHQWRRSARQRCAGRRMDIGAIDLNGHDLGKFGN